MQNVAHILKGVLINYLVIEGGFPSEILSIYGNIRCFFEILKMLICNFLADPAQCEVVWAGQGQTLMLVKWGQFFFFKQKTH